MNDKGVLKEEVRSRVCCKGIGCIFLREVVGVGFFMKDDFLEDFFVS